MKKAFSIVICAAAFATSAADAAKICKRNREWACVGSRGTGTPKTAGDTSGYTCWCRSGSSGTWIPVSDGYDSDSGSDDRWTCTRTCPGLCEL